MKQILLLFSAVVIFVFLSICAVSLVENILSMHSSDALKNPPVSQKLTSYILDNKLCDGIDSLVYTESKIRVECHKNYKILFIPMKTQYVVNFDKNSFQFIEQYAGGSRYIGGTLIYFSIQLFSGRVRIE